MPSFGAVFSTVAAFGGIPVEWCPYACGTDAQGVGHFLHRLVGGEEQQLCPLHTDCLVILHVAGAWDLAER